LSEPVISFRNVTFSYGGEPVLEDVNLSLGDREAVCVVGPNGGGKTTLVKLILGLIEPDRGEIRVFGQSPQRARLRAGYMPQHVQHDAQFPVTAMDIVMMGCLGQRADKPLAASHEPQTAIDGSHEAPSGQDACAPGQSAAISARSAGILPAPGGAPAWQTFLSNLTGWRGRADRRAAIDALDQVAMSDFRRRPFAALSGGQRQRVLIARALCCNPDLLVLDEPTSNVDTLIEGQLLDLLRKLNRRMTILMVSHDLGFVSELVDHVICVNRRVVVHPTSEMTGDAIRDIYGGEVRRVRHNEFSPFGHSHD
jgi:zinc transport system ATP-binding protein